ncbi:MAG: hypothetical protein RL326_759 [Pseudomonadota bacterium]|jgi:hypothetical protein
MKIPGFRLDQFYSEDFASARPAQATLYVSVVEHPIATGQFLSRRGYSLGDSRILGGLWTMETVSGLVE